MPNEGELTCVGGIEGLLVVGRGWQHYEPGTKSQNVFCRQRPNAQNILLLVEEECFSYIWQFSAWRFYLVSDVHIHSAIHQQLGDFPPLQRCCDVQASVAILSKKQMTFTSDLQTRIAKFRNFFLILHFAQIASHLVLFVDPASGGYQDSGDTGMTVTAGSVQRSVTILKRRRWSLFGCRTSKEQQCSQMFNDLNSCEHWDSIYFHRNYLLPFLEWFSI